MHHLPRARTSTLTLTVLLLVACDATSGADGARDASAPNDPPPRDGAPPPDGAPPIDRGDAGAGGCAPGAVEACYSGPSGTRGVGACVAGTRTCAADGSGFGPCTGEIQPRAEDCATAADDDCDGTANEAEAGCACVPGTSVPCYGGPAGTAGVGACVAGVRACARDGRSYDDACLGEVRPSPETCVNSIDDDCDGEVNEEGPGCSCEPGEVRPCYAGPAGTEGVAACAPGVQACLTDGSGFGECAGGVLPEPEVCGNGADDDCDGAVDEAGAGCACAPGATRSCYGGPAGTSGVGACAPGTQVCNAGGTAFGACAGETLPRAEVCGDGADDDCDGAVDEGCGVSYATLVPVLQAHCGPCHTSASASGLNVSTYSTTQIAAGTCAGMTQGACMLVRVRNGTMPQGRGCTGDPALDVGRPACLDAAGHALLEAWIADGQRP